MSDQAFQVAFSHTVGLEGDYSDDIRDRGRRTRFGITEAVARANGFNGDMAALPFGIARSIYKVQYWNLLKLDSISEISLKIACELFDTGVNCGVGTAGKLLQRALNAFNREAADYADVDVDGLIGPMTIAALKGFLQKRGADGETTLLKALNGMQADRYIAIAESDRTQEAFCYGQIRART